MINNKDFELIKQANASIKTTDIKGKDYAEVVERVKAFRMVHPLGSIKTEIIGLQDGIVTFKAEAYDVDGRLLATGHAQEKESSSYINKTSYIENAETSAVGRCLGLCGFGIDTSICSAEELLNAMNNQPNKTQNIIEIREKVIDIVTQGQLIKLNDLLSKDERNRTVIYNQFKINDLKQLTKEQASRIIKQLSRAKDEAEE